MSLLAHRVLIIDCQTTGQTPSRGNLLEIAWRIEAASIDHSLGLNRNAHLLEITGADDRETSSFLVQQPDGVQTLSDTIKRLTGIDEDQMINAFEKRDVQARLNEAILALDVPRICIVHFARFELPFILDLLQCQSVECLPFQLICTYEITSRLLPNLPSKSIRAVAGFFGLQCGEFKRAGAHVAATGAIWRGLQSYLVSEGLNSTDSFLAWQSQRRSSKRVKFEYPLEKSKRLQLPCSPGIYRLLSKNHTVLYVGKATSIRNRVNSYFRGQKTKDAKTRELLSQVWDVSFTETSTALEAALMETDEIKRLNPPYNKALKRRERRLVFYSRDFLSNSFNHDEQHPLGPYTNTHAIEGLVALWEALQTNDFSGEIFYRSFPESLIAESFQLFCIDEAVEKDDLKTPRSLIAVGLWIYRRWRSQIRMKKDELPDGGQIENIDNVQSLSNKFGRLLRHTARAYLRSKSLTRMLHNRLHYAQNDRLRILRIEAGKVHAQAEPEQQQASFVAQLSPHAWQGLDIDTYDRMSVLLSELPRVQLLSFTSGVSELVMPVVEK